MPLDPTIVLPPVAIGELPLGGQWPVLVDVINLVPTVLNRTYVITGPFGPVMVTESGVRTYAIGTMFTTENDIIQVPTWMGAGANGAVGQLSFTLGSNLVGASVNANAGSLVFVGNSASGNTSGVAAAAGTGSFNEAITDKGSSSAGSTGVGAFNSNGTVFDIGASASTGVGTPGVTITPITGSAAGTSHAGSPAETIAGFGGFSSAGSTGSGTTGSTDTLGSSASSVSASGSVSKSVGDFVTGSGVSSIAGVSAPQINSFVFGAGATTSAGAVSIAEVVAPGGTAVVTGTIHPIVTIIGALTGTNIVGAVGQTGPPGGTVSSPGSMVSCSVGSSIAGSGTSTTGASIATGTDTQFISIVPTVPNISGTCLAGTVSVAASGSLSVALVGTTGSGIPGSTTVSVAFTSPSASITCGAGNPIISGLRAVSGASSITAVSVFPAISGAPFGTSVIVGVGAGFRTLGPDQLGSQAVASATSPNILVGPVPASVSVGTAGSIGFGVGRSVSAGVSTEVTTAAVAGGLFAPGARAVGTVGVVVGVGPIIWPPATAIRGRLVAGDAMGDSTVGRVWAIIS